MTHLHAVLVQPSSSLAGARSLLVARLDGFTVPKFSLAIQNGRCAGHGRVGPPFHNPKLRLPHPLRFSKGGHHGCRLLGVFPLAHLLAHSPGKSRRASYWVPTLSQRTRKDGAPGAPLIFGWAERCGFGPTLPKML